MNDGLEHFKGLSYMLNLIDDKDEKKIKSIIDFSNDPDNISVDLGVNQSVLDQKVKIVKYMIEGCFYLSRNPKLFQNKEFAVLIV